MMCWWQLHENRHSREGALLSGTFSHLGAKPLQPMGFSIFLVRYRLKIIVIPAKAGIQSLQRRLHLPVLDSGFRRNDGMKLMAATESKLPHARSR